MFFLKSRETDESRAMSRRNLLKWSLFTGAALGLPSWKVYEAIGFGGRARADDPACTPTNRSVHVVAGTGGFSYFQLLWPHVEVAERFEDGFAFHAPTEARRIAGTHRPLVVGPEAPWQSYVGARNVTALLGGTNETHTRAPRSNGRLSAQNDLFAACAAIQTASPTLVPSIAIGEAPYGSAGGAPRVARVGSADDVVALFNAAASRAGAALSRREDAELFTATYSAFLALRSAAGTPTHRQPFLAGAGAARLLGQNLADRLRPTAADLLRYGIDDGSRDVNRDLAKALIVTAKAFTMGLTSMVVIPAFNDDPHGAFTDMRALRGTLSRLGRSLDAFMEDLALVDDPHCTGTTIADNTVVSIHGDTAKNPLNRANWPDATPGNSNWVYVLSGGQLRTGWFGGVKASGDVVGWNPIDGSDAPDVTSADTAGPAAAAVAYCVAKGDMRRVNDFYRGTDIRGIVSSETV